VRVCVCVCACVCVCVCVCVVHTRLLTRGFPALSSAALVNSPSSSPAGSGKHQPAALVLKELALLTADAFQARAVPASQIWAAAAAHDPDPLCGPLRATCRDT
jgi:hypothetical protein